jgi:hypothetical protein
MSRATAAGQLDNPHVLKEQQTLNVSDHKSIEATADKPDNQTIIDAWK